MNGSKFARSTMPDVSLAVMEEAKNTIRSANNKLTQTQYVEFKETCQAIYNRVNTTFDLANSSIIAVRVKLQNMVDTLVTPNLLIQALQAQLESSNSPETIKNQIKQLRQQGDANINSAIEEIKPKSESLKKEASNIEFFEFRNEVDEQVSKLNKQLEENIKPNIEKYEALKAQAQEDYDNISAAMHVLEQHNLFEFFSETIPTAEELSDILGVGMESPELAAVIAGIEVYKQFFAQVGEGFSYVQMKKLRNYITEQIDTYTNELNDLNERKRKIEINLQDLGNISIIESERFKFTEQVKNLATTYDYFIEDINSTLAAMGDYDNYNNMLELLNQMVTHLKSL